MLKARYQHSNGQLPAYEWNFGDVNPPVHAWATLVPIPLGEDAARRGDLDFLKRAFGKLLINFTWWVNRKDRSGKSVFEGGFLGLDNIGVFDRSAELPTGGHLEQADGTAWMAMFCQNMLEIAIELATHDASYEEIASKFAEHFLWIGAALNRESADGMWDEDDGFYYDVLQLPDGSAARLKVAPLSGCCRSAQRPSSNRGSASARRGHQVAPGPPPSHSRAPWRHPSGWPGARGRPSGRTILLARLNPDRLRANPHTPPERTGVPEPYGIRSVSRWHEEHPYVVRVGAKDTSLVSAGRVGQRDVRRNSNWRGPVWFPMNVLLIRALFQFHAYYGDSFQVECPTGSGRMMTLSEVATEISDRLQRIFLRNEAGRRPEFGGTEKFQNDPHWRDCIPFYEFFHGDNGAGLGASHQTGWTALVAAMAQNPWRR